MAFEAGEAQAGSGWEESCGISLFTLDWLDCSDPPRCIPWIGSGWKDSCMEQLYTLSWVCCDIIIGPEPEPPTGGGGHPVKGRRPKLYGDDIFFKGDVKKIKYLLKKFHSELKEESFTYQAEIDRFETAIEALEEMAQEVEAEIAVPTTDINLLILREFLKIDLLALREFILDLIAQVEILKLIRRKRQDEEAIIAMLMMTDPNMSIIIN